MTPFLVLNSCTRISWIRFVNSMRAACTFLLLNMERAQSILFCSRALGTENCFSSSWLIRPTVISCRFYLTFLGLILLPLSEEVLGPGDESYRKMPLVKAYLLEVGKEFIYSRKVFRVVLSFT